MQKSVIIPTAYFPSIEWCAVAFFCKNHEIEIHETYFKQTTRNHCNIATSNGLMRISVPIKKPFGTKTKTKDILVDNSQAWQTHHYRSIETAYNRSSFFLFYKDDLQKIFNTNFQYLIDLNHSTIELIAKWLKIDFEINYTADFVKPIEIEDKSTFSSFKKIEIDKLNSSTPEYYQVFCDKNGFLPKLSFLDLIFNTGPEAVYYLKDYSDILL